MAGTIVSGCCVGPTDVYVYIKGTENLNQTRVALWAIRNRRGEEEEVDILLIGYFCQNRT